MSNRPRVMWSVDLGTPYLRATAAIPCLHVLPDGGELLAGETPRPTQPHALRPGSVKSRPSAPADVLPLPAGHVGRHAGEYVAHEGLGLVHRLHSGDGFPSRHMDILAVEAPSVNSRSLYTGLTLRSRCWRTAQRRGRNGPSDSRISSRQR